MAETATNDGLDHKYNVYNRNGTPLVFFYVGLFVSQTPTTVPASTASGAAAGWEEMTATSGTYARQIVAASLISAAGNIGGSARGSAWPQVTFTGFVGASPANGYAILSASTLGAGSPFGFANFDSAASRAFSAVADSLALTPTLKYLP